MSANTLSRFRPNHDDDRDPYPVSPGSCRYCHRQMWLGSKPGTPLLSPSRRHPGACETCSKWIDHNPGQDPTTCKRSVAEVIPAERPEGDMSWRRNPNRRCIGGAPDVFEPDPFPDEPEYGTRSYRAGLQDARLAAAIRLCGPCPVREQCRTAALRHGYVGLWGAAWFTRLRWRDLLTGDTGDTIHAYPSRSAQDAA